MTPERHAAGDKTTNQVTNAHNVAQAGKIDNVFFGDQSNNDIEVLPQPEQDEIVLDTEKLRVVRVLIKNHRPEPQTLTLHLEGSPTERWTVQPDKALVQPGIPFEAAIHLSRTSTDPQTGPKQLEVVAKSGEGIPRKSKPLRVRVPAVPSLVPAERSDPPVVTHGECAIEVHLHNKGNTGLAGNLELRRPPEGDPSYLDPRFANTDDSHFKLDPGKTGTARVVLTMPSPAATMRRSYLALGIRLDDTDYQPPDFRLSIEQVGWVAQIPVQVRQLRAWGGTKLGPYRRGALVLSAVALLVVGTILGRITAPSPASAQNRNASAAGPTAQPVATTTPVGSPSSPGPYKSIEQCAAGTSVVFLAALTDQDAQYASYLAQRETSRLSNLKPKLTQAQLNAYQIHLAMRDHICSPALNDYKDPQYQVFLWVGPFATTDASYVCKDLGKSQVDDCNPVALG